MSFITPAPAESTDTRPIRNTDFFPDLYLSAARDAVRLDGTVIDSRLRDALITAMLSVNKELVGWKKKQLAAGFKTIGDVPAETIDNTSEFVLNYRRAVYCTAAANIAERLKNFDSTAKGRAQAEQLNDPIDDHRRDAHWAINDILGIGRTTIELI